DLRMHRVCAGAKERLDLQILFYRLKKEFHFPAILVNRGDRRRSKRQVIGQEHQRSLLVFIPDFDPPEEMLVALDGHAIEEDHFVAKHVAFLRDLALLDYSVSG